MTRAFTALVNPIAGGGSASRRWAAVAEGLDADVELVLTRDREHAVAAARAAAERSRIVVSVGGDGLARDVATGVVPVDGTMAIVPSGRGNDLAAALGIPSTTHELTRMLRDGAEHRLDVLQAGDTIVPGNVYVGLDSLSTVIINDNRRLPPRLLYRLAPYLALARWRPVEFRVTPDGGDPVVRRGHIAVVANSGWYGHGLHIVPSAEPDDGRLDVLIIGDVPKYRLGAFMRGARDGAHADWPEVTVVTGTSITLSADRDVPVCADGDELGALPVTVRVLPSALRLLRPNPVAAGP